MAADKDTNSLKLDSNSDCASVTSEESYNKSNLEQELSKEDEYAVENWGFPLKDLYYLALKFYRGRI